MAILKVYPEKSATIYSYYPLLNTGIDEVIEISNYDSIESTNAASRALIKFSSDDISDAIAHASGSAYSASLRLHLANAAHLPSDYTIECFPISGSWDVGTGRKDNYPQTTNGVSWTHRDNLLTTWSVSGSNWYSGSYKVTQSFVHNSIKDINLNAFPSVNAWVSSSINNDGFILKHSSSYELTSGSKAELAYFSANTHTIYPPCLEIKWNDSSFSTGSSSVINTENIILSITNNKGTYEQDSVQTFNINVRNKYPTRTFQTSSVYLNNSLLPSSSYWAIKDLDTDEIPIDFDPIFTKISSNSTGSYFKLYMNTLEPMRNYKILIQTVINGNVLIFDNNYYFKVIK